MTKLFQKSLFGFKLPVVRLFQAAAFALIVALAWPMPVRAADDRGVKQKVAVIYPAVAKRMGIEGTVAVEATVDASGKVKDAKSLSGNPILAPAAEDSVRQWVFEPGSSISKVRVEVSFAMQH